MKLLLVLIFTALLFQSTIAQIDASSVIKVRSYDDKKQTIHSLVDSIEVYFKSSKFKLMVKCVDSVKLMIEPEDRFYYKIKSYEAASLMYNQSFKEAIDFSRRFIKSSSQLDSNDVIRFEFVLSNSLCHLDNYQNKEAKKYVLKTETSLSRGKYEDMNVIRITNLLSLASIYYYEAKYDSVIYYLDRVRTKLDKDDYNKWGDYFSLKSNVEVSRGNYAKGLNLLKQAADFYVKKNNEFKLLYCYYNMGDLFRGLNIEDSTFYYFKKAKSLALKYKSTVMIAYLASQLGDIYLERKDYKLALEEIKQGEQLFYEVGNYHGLSHSLLNLAMLESEYRNNQAAAIKLADTALVYSRKIDDGKLIETCYNYLSIFHEKNGNLKMAIKYLKLFNDQNKKIIGLDVQANIDALEITYNTKLLKERNVSYSTKILNQTYVIENQRKKILILILSALFLFTVVIFIYKIFKKSMKINAINSELNELKIAEAKSTEARLISELRLIQKSLKEKNELNSLLQMEEGNLIDVQQVRSLISVNNDWVNFILKIKILFPGFIEKLEGLDIDFTVNEFRLSILIRFNLSDKEIAEILCIEYSSVKKAKVRLKKKMNVDPDIKLLDHLNQLG